MKEDKMEQIETKGFYARDYGLNVDVPANMNDADFKDYTYHLNRGLTKEERIGFYKKPISWEQGSVIAERSRANPEKEAFSESAWKGVKNFAKTGWNQAIDLVTSFGTPFNELIPATVLSFAPDKEKARQILLKNIKDYNEARDFYKFDTSDAGVISSGLGSVGLSTLAGAATSSNPLASALFLSAFGAQNYRENLETMLEEGASIKEANLKALTTGGLEIASEKAGLGIASKYTGTLLRKYAARFGTEALQELWQEIKDQVILGKYDTRSEQEKAEAAAYSFLFGGIGGMVGFSLLDISTRTPRKNIKSEAVKSGYTEQEAEQIQLSVLDEGGAEYRQELQNKMVERVNQQIKETRSRLYDNFIENGDPASIAAAKAQMLAPDFDVAKKEIEDIVQSGFIKEDLETFKQDYEQAVERGGEDAAQYLAAKEGLQEKLSEVLSEEKAASEASMWTGLAINSYKITKDAGKIPDVNFEDFANQYFALNRLKIKNYAKMTAQEADEIWRERLTETAEMSDEDRYREESGIGKLYSAAMYRSPLKDFGAFYDDVMRGGNKKPRFYTKTVDGVELDIPSNALHHDNNKHGLTKEEWNGILQAINDNRIDEARIGDYSRMNGVPVKMVVDVDGVKYGVTFEHMNNGRNLIQTAFEVTDKGWIKNKSSQTAASEPQPKSSRLGNSMSAIISSLNENVKKENKLYSENFGSYDPDTQIVELMKGHNPSTLTHELSHHFFISHIRLMEEMGLNDRNKPVFDWLSKKGGHKINSLKDIKKSDWENMTEAFIEYMNTNEAPNLATKSLFQRAKEWLLDNYNIHRTEASAEIRDYFDSLISKDTSMPDMSKVKNQLGHISEMLAQAQRGESVTFKDVGKKELQDLQKALHTRIRRKGMSLKDELIASGGIKEGTELAKSLGFDVLKQDKMFTNKEIAISKEDELIEWLSDKGYITPVQEGETAENISKRWDEVQRLIDNAENVYTPKEQAINQERETAIRNQAQAQEIVDTLLKDNKLGLKTIDDLDNLLSRTISKQDDVDIVKVNENALKYINVATKDANRLLRNALNQSNQNFKNQREEQYQAQNDLKDFIRSLPINGQHKVSLMGNIQRVKGYDTLRDVVNSIKPRIDGYIEQERKHLYKNIIEDTLKSTRPKSKNKQNYLYEDNKLFAELRDIRTMEREKAAEKLEDRIKAQESEQVSDYDLLVNAMLGYKIQGMDSSVASMKNLADALVFAKNNAIQNKEDFDIARSEKRKEEREKMLEYLKNTPKTNKLSEKLIDVNSDFYTLTSEMFGKEWADKYEMLSVFGEQETDYANRVFAADEQGRKIYGVKDGYEFIDIIVEKSKKKYHLQGTNLNSEYSEDISLLDIMDIYLGMKNKETKESFLRNYEEFDAEGTQLTNQLDNLINNLSAEDRHFADMLQNEVQKYRDEENKAFIKRFGIDMPNVENYWMRTSLHTDTDIDAYRELALSIPSMFKARSSKVIPEPRNAYEKFKRHTTDSSYAIKVFDKYKEIYDLVKNDTIVRAIRSKYGDNRWNELRSVLQGMGAKQYGKMYSELASVYNGFISRIVGAKVKASFSVFAKQLVSVTNYAENMPIDEYTKNIGFAIAYPKQAEEFVRQYIGDFVDARYKLGRQNQALAAEVAQSRQGKQGIIKAGTKAKLDDFFSYGIRKGDILPIIKGGYAKAKYMAEQGKGYEEIRRTLIRETLRSQQAGNAASVSNFQRQHSLLSAYQNTAYQYARILNTAYIQYKRGEISSEQFAKTYLNYGVIQPFLYVSAGYFASSFMHIGDDDWEGEVPFLDFITEILAQPVGIIPLAKDAVKITANKIAGERIYAIEPVVLADINKSIRKLSKKEIELMDWVDIFTPVMEGVINVPAGQIMRWVKLGENILD